MKRILAIVLVVLMCASALMLSSCGKTKTTDKPANPSSPNTEISKPSSLVPSNPVPSDDGEPTPNDIFNLLEVDTSTAEHKKADSLPSSVTLVGSDFLPAIDNRNGINCQAAEAITYLQFTNAVARFVKNKNPGSTWTPATNFASCFSPKSTFYGTSAAASYDVLRDNGALTNEVDGFAKNATGGSIIKRNGRYEVKSIAWQITAEQGLKALDYRLLKYEAIGTSNTSKLVTADGYYDSETKGVKITNSDNGKQLLEKIKDAIATGNVVVAQGYSDRWVTEKMTGNSGTLGKRNDTVIPYAGNTSKNVYQIAIVGYDDDLEYTCCGATLKGAFLLANCEGTTWGTNGYAWLMYDALNTNSEFEDFKVPDGVTRSWAVDTFYFTYWDVDITDEKPALYAEVKLDISNRTAFKIDIYRTDALNRTNTTQISQTYHASSTGAPKYDLESGYFNPAGIENGPAVTGIYTVSFARLLTSMPKSATYENFIWGVKISSTSEDYPVTVKSIVLKNAEGTVVSEINLGEGETITKNNYTYVFDFGAEKTVNYLSGAYTLQNVASGKYFSKDAVMTFKPGDTPMQLVMKYDSETGTTKIWRDDEKYVIDAISNKLSNGASLQFNAEDSKSRNIYQAFNVSFNKDGTVSFYLKSENGNNYALGEVDGNICLVKAMALSDNIKWNITRVIRDTDAYTTGFMTKTESGFSFSGILTNRKLTSVNLKVVNLSDGSEVLNTTASVKDRKFTADLAVTTAGTYVVRVINPDDNSLLNGCYIFTVK